MNTNGAPVAAIIGGGFCGLMTAINLIENAAQELHIVLINDGFATAKGVAFSAHTDAYLLNVPASNMSCYADDLRHFLRWLQGKDAYKTLPENLLERTFVPRKLYGEYLEETWQFEKRNNPWVSVEEIEATATAVAVDNNKAIIHFEERQPIHADYVVLATGNEKPSSPHISNMPFYQSRNYYANPWNAAAVRDCGDKDVLIIGNGLTMVDTVLGLLEQNFKGTIYSLSPNGFSLLPHISNGVLYKELLHELKPPYSLDKLYKLFSKHIRTVSAIGLSAEPVIDSVRVKTQEIWAALSIADKRQFLRHIKYKWGIARHRIPAHIHRKLQQLRIDKKLICYKASLQDIEENEEGIVATFYNKETKVTEQVKVTRVINCTGPVCDISRSDNALIKQMVENNLITPDPLRLGINATFNGEIISASGEVSDTLYTLGSHMKGILWESTAVPDLRVQAERLALLLLNKMDRYINKESGMKIAAPRISIKIPQVLRDEELIEYYI